MSSMKQEVEFELCPGRKVGTNHPCFIIAEIGQNHQGDVEIAKKMILAAKKAGVDCVKFQKSTVLERFNKKCLERPYDVPQSWGKTYGEHKLYLEFSEDAYFELQKYAKEVGVFFTASAFDFNAVNFLAKLKVPFLKVPSCDTGNLEFIEFMAEKNIPMVISSGMQDMETMRRVYHIVKKHHSKFTFLQCTSAYPVTAESTNLRVIETFREQFPDIVVGYSGHETGLNISLGAVAIGAKVLERHVTLDKTWKGTDHKASLDMDELAELVKQVRMLETALGSPTKQLLDVESSMKRKLGKSVVVVGDLTKGTVLSKQNMTVKNAEPCGFPPQVFDKLLGATLTRDLEDDETILESDVVFPAAADRNQKFAAVILARKGSKGVKDKNIKPLNGLPLMAWSILAARRAACFDEIWVSTDSDEIGHIAEQFGARYFRRDPQFALDRSSSREALLDFVHRMPDVWAVAMLQCTFPTQDPGVIAKAAEMIKKDQVDCVFSVTKSHKFRWTPVGASEEDKYTRPLNFDPLRRPRRQDWDGEIIESGAFYMFTTREILTSGHYQSSRVSHIMGNETAESVDIDTEEDFVKAELLLKKHNQKFNLDDLVGADVRRKLAKMDAEKDKDILKKE